MESSVTPAGRPRLSSRQMLEDAATELFLENGYAGTTVDQIAARAGVSRNTFFNYFASKSELLWLEVDEALDALAAQLAEGPPPAPSPAIASSPATASLRSVLLDAASRFGSERIPLTFTQDEAMGAREEVVASGMQRVARLSAILSAALVSSAAPSAPAPGGGLRAHATANAMTGLVATAWVAWARAGVGRGPLRDYIAEVLQTLPEL